MNIRLLLAYDGTNYHGFQIQAPEKEPTVQGVLEKAIFRLTGEKVRVIAAGRTDAGVHALGQVVNFHCTRPLPEKAWVPALNSLLPTDIRVLEAAEVAESFHARYNAIRKTYRYLIQNGTQPSIFWQRYAWWFPYPLDEEAMRRAGEYLVGEHDFSAFRGSGATTKTAVRSLRSITWQVTPLTRGDLVDLLPSDRKTEQVSPFGRLLAMEFTADGFLYQMVRIIVGTLVEVGGGRLKPEDLQRILASRNRCLAGPTAPPHGLCLVRVEYHEK